MSPGSTGTVLICGVPSMQSMIHEDTEALLYYLLKMLAIKGEKATFSFVKYELLKGKVPYEKKELEKRTEALQ